MAEHPNVALIGRANVGKSSLFNRLVGSRHAVTDQAAGTTRDAVAGVVKWGRHEFKLFDTAGLKPSENELEVKIRKQVEVAASNAQVIVLVADASGVVTHEDLEAAKLALKTKRPVVLALNKIDAAGPHVDEFRQLGISSIIAVSAIHGQGSGELLDWITSHLKPFGSAPPTPALKLALLGRPNVGKSSLLNALGAKQHALVSDTAGTTRDINFLQVKYHNQVVELTDTAGLRRRGRILPGVEKFSTIRTHQAIAACDIAVVVMDATEPNVAQDQRIAGLVTEAGKGLILVMNKWDAVEKDDKTQARLSQQIQQNFQFCWWAPLVFTSAETGLNVSKLFELALAIAERRRVQISTSKLNQLLETLSAKQPPAGLGRYQPKLNYITQTDIEPPTFSIFGSHTDKLHFSYRRYLENGLRQAFDFIGTPIRIEFKAKRKEL